jgi:hypothetical protein
MEKTASFTAKLANNMALKKVASSSNRPTSPGPKARTSVNPTQRAAMDAQYRTSLYLSQVRFLIQNKSNITVSWVNCNF